MRTRRRLLGLKQFLFDNLCKGREMKAPAPDFDIKTIRYKEPKVYLGWNPTRPDSTGLMELDPDAISPGILVMPRADFSKYIEAQHFDRYSNIHRGQDMGRGLSVTILFSVYEPGVRLPGFIDVAVDETDTHLIEEGTEEGLFALTDWMDDCMQLLLTHECIPGTDLTLVESEMTYSPVMENNFITDKRPLFYGYINCNFKAYADDGVDTVVHRLLD